MEQLINQAQIVLALCVVIALACSFCQINNDRKRQRIETLIKYSAHFHINCDLTVVTEYLEEKNNLKHYSKSHVPDDYQILAFVRFFAEIELLIQSRSLDSKPVCEMFERYIRYFK